MSQEKVDKYKKYKAHRKQILAREKKKKMAARIIGWTVFVAVVLGIGGGIGWNAWRSYQEELASRPDYTASGMMDSDLVGVLDETETAAEE